MSPAAIGGPHLRATSINSTGPINTTRRDWDNGIDNSKGESRVLPHLDDLVNAKPLVDRQSSLRKLLEAGEEAAKQAETLLDFKRLDLALQQYIVAFTIAVEYIPQSPHYPDLRTRPDYPRLYAGLQKRLNLQHSRFEEVKRLIKEDNARTGISPSNSFTYNGRPVSGNIDNSAFEPTMPDVYSNAIDRQLDAIDTTKRTESRPKPTVQPKPQGLHGKSIQTANSMSPSLSISSENDLAARFARLRGSNNLAPIQDPRIRTQQITIPDGIIVDQKSTNAVPLPKQNASILRPLGPREMPTSLAIPLKTEKPILGMSTSVPGMPRMPDAIYSPARSADVASTNSQPPLLSRGSSYLNGKKESSNSTSKMNRNRIAADDTMDYFSSPEVNNYTFDHDSPEPETAINRLSIPSTTTITAEQLYDYLKMGSNTLSLLLVDIRSREEFDEGHIMSQSIICIEPISLGKDMSAEELGDRIVLSPESEQRLYNQRHIFDLIVYYDQSSTLINMEHPSAELLNNLQYFSKIIFDHAYDCPLKRRPMLLDGGLDSWVDLVGSGALQGAIPGSKSLPKTKKHDHHALGRVSIAREPRRSLVTKRTISRSRALSAAEEEKWDKALKECAETDDAPAEELAMDESRYARTTEEFMRRYPELSTIKQSMALPSKPRSLPPYDGPMISAPPTRPPPALPRQRSNGISEKTPYKNYAMTGGNSSAPPPVEPGLCGLRNVTGSLCYMNTAIQILSASPAIRNMFIRFQYPCNPAIPKKEGEDSPPRLLMTRALRSLLQHMWCGKYDEIVPRMFQQYVHATAVAHKGHLGANPERGGTNVHTPDTTYGTARQHDCGEFLGFLSDTIMDEQNINRDKLKGLADAAFLGTEDPALPRTRNCCQAQERALECSNSPLGKLICSQLMWENTCDNCGDQYVCSSMLGSSIPLLVYPDGGARQTLDSLLQTFTYQADPQSGAKCDACSNENNTVTKTKKLLFSHLPDYLIMNFNKVQFGRDGKHYRTNVRVDFPEILDMGKYTWLSEKDDYSERIPAKHRPPFLYDCYAVVQHEGTPEAGHYWALARRIDANNTWTDEWHKFSDASVEPGKRFTDAQSAETVMLLYRRQGSA
ncbi:8c3bcf77-56a6-4abb-a942-858670656755 [Sclerotinia trifoliorum]|uniref:8c3bcf77-56a6-4abb-a942-858670656755 n=1 Tax=Sclerotinia trifoliorum TaxID=28548 RepID=A0A8H2W3F0_9HELO|nr:8c3bcf77-56a6-4abb-a942-858670656755 [Sclerotinia trifoliorum]